MVGCLLDCGEAGGSVAFTKNGRPLGEAFKLPDNLRNQVRAVREPGARARLARVGGPRTGRCGPRCFCL